MIKTALTSELLTQAFSSEGCKDAKLSEIGLFLKGLIYKDNAAAQEETKEGSKSAQGEAEAAERKKALQSKKRAAMMARMKKKAAAHLQPDATAGGNAEGPLAGSIQTPSEEVLFSQQCAACQEPLDINQFYQRPFTQLCHLAQTKLLYHTYR